MDDVFLEQLYERIILPYYENDVYFGAISWVDHGKVGLDAWAHYFKGEDGKRYVLLYEDFPDGSYMADDPTHKVIKVGGEPSHWFGFSADTRLIPNVTGYFTLYKEKQ